MATPVLRLRCQCADRPDGRHLADLVAPAGWNRWPYFTGRLVTKPACVEHRLLVAPREGSMRRVEGADWVEVDGTPDEGELMPPQVDRYTLRCRCGRHHQVSGSWLRSRFYAATVAGLPRRAVVVPLP